MKTNILHRATICLMILFTAMLLAGCGIFKGAAPAAKTTPTASTATAGATQVSGASTSEKPTGAAESSATATTSKGNTPANSGDNTSAATATKVPTLPANPGELKGMPASLRKLGNLRVAPGTDAEVLAILEAGTQVGVLGVTPSLTWAQVTAPGNMEGWIYFGNLELTGDQKDLIRVEPTATPAE